MKSTWPIALLMCLLRAAQVALIASEAPARGQDVSPTSHPATRAADLKWEGVQAKAPSRDEFWVVMSSGFMGVFGLSEGAPHEVDERVGQWLGAHPQAVVIVVRRPVADLLPFVYVWLVDGDDNLAVDLVRDGLVDSQSVKVRLGEEDELAVPRPIYDTFAARVRTAEIDAIQANRGRWQKDGNRQDTHATLARHYMEERDYRQAAAEYERAAEACQHVRDRDDPDCILSYARFWADCYTKIGEHEKALAVLTRALAAARKSEPGAVAYLEGCRAAALAARDGAAAGAKHLADLCRTNPDRLDYLQALCAFHLQHKSFAEGLDLAAPGLAAWLQRHGVTRGATVALTQDDVTQLPPDDLSWLSALLHALAQLATAAGKLDTAETFARSALALAQHQRASNPSDEWPPEIVAAGGVNPRLCLAEIAMRRSKFDEAHAQIDHAKLLAEQTGGSPLDRTLVREAYAQLQRTFPDKTLHVPATRPATMPAQRPPPPPPPRTPQLEPKTLAQLDDSDLLDVATERKTLTQQIPFISCFDAMDELCRRADQRRLDAAVWDNAVQHALTLQADPAADWRGRWGCLIELTWVQNRLKPAQLRAYAAYALCLRNLRIASVIAPGENRKENVLECTCAVASRVGDCPYPLEPRGVRMTANVQIEHLRVDGRELAIPERDREFGTDIGGSEYGFRFRAPRPPWIGAGKHTAEVEWQLRIWRQVPNSMPKDTDPVLSERTVSLRTEFELPE